MRRARQAAVVGWTLGVVAQLAQVPAAAHEVGAGPAGERRPEPAPGVVAIDDPLDDPLVPPLGLRRPGPVPMPEVEPIEPGPVPMPRVWPPEPGPVPIPEAQLPSAVTPPPHLAPAPRQRGR
jgi:hypothetical protein